ncbi:MAG: hypothetical protein J6Y08_04455 [Clostridiales bacterium]|nr:hypothetical protein [Clostridiales bacterium]
MKTTGGRDTFLLFIVLLIALGAVCWLLVIQKNMNKLKATNVELEQVRQEKAEKDAIIQQAQELDQQCEDLKNQLTELEKKFLPELYTDAIQRKLYKHFEDAGTPYYVEISNTPLEYELAQMPDGSTSRNQVFYSRYTVAVSGTDGFLLTHDEGDDIPYSVYTNQLLIGNNPEVVNPAADATGVNPYAISSEYIGYEEFIEALKKIQADAPDYVKITDIKIEDTLQGFCTYSATVNVYAYDLVDRISKPNYDMNYMKWVGAENITTGGLVGLPSYFMVKFGGANYTVSPSSPLYGKFISFVDYDFQVNRPFAAWTHWAFEWTLLDTLLQDAANMDPEMLEINMLYQLGMITPEEYAALVDDYNQRHADMNQQPTI